MLPVAVTEIVTLNVFGSENNGLIRKQIFNIIINVNGHSSCVTNIYQLPYKHIYFSVV
jgi:hypothetical protein